MKLTARQLNRATLARQLLLRREALPPADGVKRVVALQAQQPASPYIALWNRLAAFDARELDAAFAAGAVVKATLMRITLHAVHAADYPAAHVAMQPTLRGSCLSDERFTGSGLDADGADALVPEVVSYLDQPRTNAEIERFLEARVPRPAGVWWALRRFAPVHHAVTGGPWSFGHRPSYVAAPDRRHVDPGAAVAHLVRRYLEAFGPATAQDLGQFALLRGARKTLMAVDGLERLEGPGGAVLFDVAGAERPDEEAAAPPRLLGMWESILLAYADRSRVIPPAYRPHVTRRNGDVLPTLLVDGYVAGVWRPLEGGVEATAFEPLSDDAWAGLDSEARALVGFLADREPGVYGRFGHWWQTLPAAEVRVLGS
jgi:hypothetical protein